MPGCVGVGEWAQLMAATGNDGVGDDQECSALHHPQGGMSCLMHGSEGKELIQLGRIRGVQGTAQCRKSFAESARSFALFLSFSRRLAMCVQAAEQTVEQMRGSMERMQCDLDETHMELDTLRQVTRLPLFEMGRGDGDLTRVGACVSLSFPLCVRACVRGAVEEARPGRNRGHEA